jgi:catechol 2,3-dioxygenase-like lactoylglutathione lyase family enzyme
MFTRRETLGILGAAALGAADAPFSFTGLDHIEFTVTDVKRSVEFYTRIFGNALMKNARTERRYLKLGSAYIAMEPAKETRVDHFSVGIQGFDVEKIHTFLKGGNIAYRDFPSGKDLNVTDPDGIRMQLSVSDGWTGLTGGTAAPESVATSGQLFTPMGIEHILLNVTDVAASAAFYAQILGPVSSRGNERTWFQVGKSRVGLLKTPAGQRAGVNHYCVTAQLDYDDAVRKLEGMGVRVGKPEVAGAPEFYDPDGFLVQAMRPR